MAYPMRNVDFRTLEPNASVHKVVVPFQITVRASLLWSRMADACTRFCRAVHKNNRRAVSVARPPAHYVASSSRRAVLACEKHALHTSLATYFDTIVEVYSSGSFSHTAGHPSPSIPHTVQGHSRHRGIPDSHARTPSASQPHTNAISGPDSLYQDPQLEHSIAWTGFARTFVWCGYSWSC